LTEAGVSDEEEGETCYQLIRVKIGVSIVAVLLLFLTLGFPVVGQRTKITKEGTRIFDERLNKSYESGEEGFVRYVASNLNYPAEARTKGVMGLSVVAFKVGCDGKPYGLQFKTKLGFGIEQEVERVIKKTKGDWLPCNERDTLGWINFKIAFTLNDLYDSPDAFLQVSANGDFPGVSDDTLIEDLKKATQENKHEEARMALTKLVMRFPYNQDYRKQLIELNKK
jgi:hypothetical protein